MAQITIQIPDGIAQRVLISSTNQLGYQPVINGEQNPETRIQFLKKNLIRFILENVRNWEGRSDAVAASTARLEEIEANITPNIS